MIKGFIFDYGGTLDTGGCHWGRMIWHAYERHHVPVSEEQFRQAYVYAERRLGSEPIIMPHFTFRQTLQTKISLQMQHLGLGDSLTSAIVDDVYAQTISHTAHSIEVLRQLSAHWPLVLVSNFYGNLTTVLQEFGFDGLFRQVIESAVAGVRKPDERIFLLGIQALNLQPLEVMVVGDSIGNDILPAQRLGCQTTWYKGEQWDATAKESSMPDSIITDLSQLMQYA